MEHQTFQLTVEQGIRWPTLYKFTESNRKESKNFALLFILLTIVFNQFSFSESAIGSLLAGILSLIGIVHAIRWFYLFVKEKFFKNSNYEK